MVNEVITIGNYVFKVSGRKIVVASQGEKDIDELRVITELYKEHKCKNKHRGRPLNGKFRWCRNPECNNAFYAFRCKMEKGEASCCSRYCTSKFFGCPKGHQIGKLKMFKCSACGEIIDKIPGCPGICPVCKEIAAFMIIRRKSKPRTEKLESFFSQKIKQEAVMV